MVHISCSFTLKIFYQKRIALLLCLQQIGTTIKRCIKDIRIYTSGNHNMSTTGGYSGCTNNSLSFSIGHNFGCQGPLIRLRFVSKTAMMHHAFCNALG